MNKLSERPCYSQEERSEIDVDQKCIDNIKKIIEKIEANLRLGWQIEDRLLLQNN
ncbi:hypothetical protein AAEX28_07410 [Lentisphaerota bacterium WC36G]|nr:hypothetical protein LJT99_10270 [Lentisphaerae bacterium WC36]